jgi:hypothetical protein
MNGESYDFGLAPTVELGSCASIGSLASLSAAPLRPVWCGRWHGRCRPSDPPFSTKAPPPSGGARERKRPGESPTCRVVYFYFGALQYLKLKTKNKEPPIARSTFVCTHRSLDIYKGSALKCRGLAWLVIAHACINYSTRRRIEYFLTF